MTIYRFPSGEILDLSKVKGSWNHDNIANTFGEQTCERLFNEDPMELWDQLIGIPLDAPETNGR